MVRFNGEFSNSRVCLTPGKEKRHILQLVPENQKTAATTRIHVEHFLLDSMSFRRKRYVRFPFSFIKEENNKKMNYFIYICNTNLCILCQSF